MDEIIRSFGEAMQDSQVKNNTHETHKAIQSEHGNCNVCRESTTKKCGKCKVVYYCSKNCQSSDWRFHKYKCSQTLSMPASGPDISESSKCSVCLKDSNRKCNRCKLQFYCSRDCQKSDWKKHKKTCELASSVDIDVDVDMLSSFYKKMANFKIPEFHKEYATTFPSDKTKIKLLSEIYVTCYQHDSEFPNSFSLEYEESQSAMMHFKRWGFHDAQSFEYFLKEKLKVGDIVEREVGPFNFHDQGQNYYAMKNFPVRNIPLYIGKTYVSIGFIDFQQLLMSDILDSDDNSQDPLRFIGYDSCFIPVAKSLILYHMIKSACEPKSILQVWFSSAWNDRTKSEFTEICQQILKLDNITAEVRTLVEYWASANLSVDAAQSNWFQETENRALVILSNMKSERDRIDYARYVFTGMLFEDNEKSYTHGSVLYKLPPSFQNYFRVDESIFATITQPLQSQMQTPFLQSLCKILFQRLSLLAPLICNESVICEFRVGHLSPTSAVIFDEIKAMKPFMIDWSNIFDYFDKKDAWCILRACHSPGTFHYAHFMNWIHMVFGASFVDYGKEWQTLFPQWKKKAQKLFDEAKNNIPFLRKDHFFKEPINISDKFLASECIPFFFKYFFNDGKQVNMVNMNFEDLNIFERSNTTFDILFEIKN